MLRSQQLEFRGTFTILIPLGNVNRLPVSTVNCRGFQIPARVAKFELSRQSVLPEHPIVSGLLVRYWMCVTDAPYELQLFCSGLILKKRAAYLRCLAAVMVYAGLGATFHNSNNLFASKCFSISNFI
jgi:hypothetical protein